MDRLSGGVLRKENIRDNELSNQKSRHWQVDLYMWCCAFYIWHLLVKRKSSKALASSGHMVSNFPDEACWRATGSPMDNTLSRDDTASFHVLSDGQAYFRPKGILKVWRMNKGRDWNTEEPPGVTFHLPAFCSETERHIQRSKYLEIFLRPLQVSFYITENVIEHLFNQVLFSENSWAPHGWGFTSIAFLFWRQKKGWEQDLAVCREPA